MGMRLPPPRPAPSVGVRQIATAESLQPEPLRAVEKITTRPDTGPHSRRKGSVVTLPDYPVEKTR